MLRAYHRLRFLFNLINDFLAAPPGYSNPTDPFRGTLPFIDNPNENV